jgi:hypothetical protein
LEVRDSFRPENYTPEQVLFRQSLPLQPGMAQPIRLKPDAAVGTPRYVNYLLLRNPDVSAYLSEARVTGVLTLAQSMNKAVAKGARQEPPVGIGIDSFEFWLPARRPAGRNLAARIEPPLLLFSPENVRNGIDRPTLAPNAWVARPGDSAPALTLEWPAPRTIATVVLCFDTDFDHPMESVLMGHPERDMPFCVSQYRILDGQGALLHECRENHQTRNIIRFAQPVTTTSLQVVILATHGAPAALFGVRCYAP